jgi:hypothetical protein
VISAHEWYEADVLCDRSSVVAVSKAWHNHVTVSIPSFTWREFQHHSEWLPLLSHGKAVLVVGGFTTRVLSRFETRQRSGRQSKHYYWHFALFEVDRRRSETGLKSIPRPRNTPSVIAATCCYLLRVGVCSLPWTVLYRRQGTCSCTFGISQLCCWSVGR